MDMGLDAERRIQEFLSTFAESQIELPVTQPVKSLAALIDHTVLKADATSNDITRACHEAIENSFATVCVNSSFIPLAARILDGSAVKPIAVVGFPLGAMLTSAKAFEAYEAIREGAREIDMVLPIGLLKERAYDRVFKDIEEVVKACEGIPVKVILETAILTREEKIAACLLSKDAGAAFVKTSTGFASGGATVQDVTLMRKVVGPEMGVKASGGIRTLEDALKMIEAGANRIGASASVAIIKNAAKSQETGLY